MDTSTIKVIDRQFNFLGDIEDYESFYFVRNFTKSKEFQIIAPIKYVNILKDKNIIFTTQKKAGFIEEVKLDEDKNIITVKGRDLKSIMDRRITIPEEGKAYDEIKSNAETAIKHYINNNCINPKDSNRKIQELEIADNLNRGPIISWQSRYKYLDSEIEQICSSTGIGWEIYLDLDKKKFIVDIIEGVNRTIDQDINSRVIFSDEFDNISNSTHIENSKDYKTMSYTAGQGEGENRAIKEVYRNNNTGLDRRELFIDARDIDEADKLEDRSWSKLNQYNFISSSEGTIINSNYKYEEHWNLGDLITTKNLTGYKNQRVSEVTEIFEGFINIEVVLGDLVPTVLDNIKTEISNISTSGISSSGGDKSYEFNQLSPKKIWNIPHGLNKRPSVTIVDSGGTEVKGDVKYDDNNNATISFTAAFAGMAYLN